MKGFFDGIVPHACVGLQKTVSRHGARVPVATLIFVERIADAPVVTAANGAKDRPSFGNVPLEDQMCRHLIFDARPYFVAVDKGQHGPSSVRPGAQKQTAVMLDGITGPLRVCMGRQIGAEVVVEDVFQAGFQHIFVDQMT